MELTDLIWLGIGMIIGYFIFRPMFVFKRHPREAGSVSKNEANGNFCATCNEPLNRNGYCFNENCKDNHFPF